MFTKLTKSEKDWILYDVGNSAFILLVSTVMPLYYITMVIFSLQDVFCFFDEFL